MKFNQTFPYPVLAEGNDNYNENSKFTVEIEPKLSFGSLHIQADFHLQDDMIKHLIDEEKALYMLYVECPQSSYRQVFKSTHPKQNCVIDDKKLRGKVDIHSFVVAQEKIQDYQNKNLTEFYSGISWHYNKGHMLAIGDAIELSLFESDQELINLPSIVKILCSDDAKLMKVDMQADHIIIMLPKDEYEHYASNANARMKDSILAMVIVPSLVYVFSKLREENTDYEDYKWYRVLTHLFEKNDYHLNDIVDEKVTALEAAQLILQNPINKAFAEIEKLNRLEEE